MLRCTQTPILFLAWFLTSCLAPPLTPAPTAEMRAPAGVPVAAPLAPAATVTDAISARRRAPATPAAPVTPPRATTTRAPTRQPSPAPTPPAPPAAPAVTLTTNANLRAGPGTAYPVIGNARAGQLLLVTGQAAGRVGDRPVTWWRTLQGWVAGSLVAANAAAPTVPRVTDAPPPAVEAQVEVKVKPSPSPASTLTLTSASSLPDLVVLGPETQYPVRARVIQGWDYEFVDLSAAYDIIVYRDVFGLLAHQIDDENIRRYWPHKTRVGTYGPLRVVLVDAEPHPDARCPGWGWAAERETYAGDPLGLNTEPCWVQHALAPTGAGAGTTLVSGWGSYAAGTSVAVLAAGPGLADCGTTFLAERLPRPATLSPAARPDFGQPLYQLLGAAHQEDGHWVWHDPFAQIVPAAR